MTDKLGTVELPSPKSPKDGMPTTAVGQRVPPIERIKIFSPTQWEDFILEWVDSLRPSYDSVEKCAGAGDMGRDVVATTKDASDVWDNFQCKHYKDPLRPTDIWVELGKLVYYTRRGDYSFPRHYYFVAPQGAGTKLSNLLRRPDALRADLIKCWDKYCKDEITTTEAVELDQELQDYIAGLDFSIFLAIPPLRIIEGHSKTRWFVYRFGGELPRRPPLADPPEDPAEEEATYVRALLDAYADHLKLEVGAVEDVNDSDIRDHFSDARREFYSAESLRAFSRDTLPPGEFELLQDEVHDGIKDEVRERHVDGYRRVLAVTKLARCLQLSARALSSHLSPRDRGGVCHQLANDEKVRWVR